MARLVIEPRSVGRPAAEGARRRFSTRSEGLKEGSRGRGGQAGGVLDDADEVNQESESESELSSVPSDLSDDDGNFGEDEPVNKRLNNARGLDVPTNSSPYFASRSSLGKRQRDDAPFARDSTPLPSAATQEARKRLRSAPSVRKLIASLAYGGPAEASSSRIRNGIGSQDYSEELPDATPSKSRRKRSTRDSISSKRDEMKTGEQREQAEEEAERRPSVSDSKGKQKKKATPSKRPVHAPPHWQEMYDLVKEMRKKVPAPVDTMGCERLADEDAEPPVKRFQTLVSLMLSSQTKDTVTAIAMRKLQTLLPGGLTVASILAVSPAVLDRHIQMVGFHNRKTQYLKQTAQILRDKYEDDIPNTIAGLCELPGVGPKMAHLCMSAAWDDTQGIGVDVHVHRITNMWGWVKTDTPEQTRVALEAWLPKDRWREINHLLVGFGQSICLSRGSKCGECMLAEQGLCRASKVPPGKRVKAEVKSEVKDEGSEVKMEGGGPRIKRAPRIKTEIKVEDEEQYADPNRVPAIKQEIKAEIKEEETTMERFVKLEIKNEEDGADRMRLDIKEEYDEVKRVGVKEEPYDDHRMGLLDIEDYAIAEQLRVEGLAVRRPRAGGRR